MAFQRCFVAWMAALTKTSTGVIAIDGKMVALLPEEGPDSHRCRFRLRRPPAHGARAGHGGDKSNEIVAISALPALLAIEGAVVTIDAMGCQRDIAQKIIDKKADTILALKGNQGTLRDDVELFARGKSGCVGQYLVSRDAPSTATTAASRPGRSPFSTTSAGSRQPPMAGPEVGRHGRKPTGKGGQGRNRDALLHHFARPPANALGPMIRSHWMVENGLHWVLDMIFRDHECRVRTENAPFNLAIIKHIALNVLRTGKGKIPCACAAKSPPGTKTPSPPTSPHETFSRFPCRSAWDNISVKLPRSNKQNQ